MTVDEKQLRLTLNHLFRSSRGNELYPALLEMLDRDALMFSTFIMKSLFFLARYFSIVQFRPLSMRVWWPFEKNRTCTSFLVPAMPG